MKTFTTLLTCIVLLPPLNLLAQSADETTTVHYSSSDDEIKTSIFIGGTTGITRLLDRDNHVRSETGYIAGLVAGLDFRTGSKSGGMRLSLFWNKIQYEATSGEGKYRIVQQTLTPGFMFRIPVISFERFQTCLGGGLYFPIMLSSNQRVNYGKYLSDDPDLPWLGMMPAVQLDFRFNKRVELGASYYVAPMVDVGGFNTDPNNCQLWVAYHFW